MLITATFNTRSLSIHATTVTICLPESNEVPENGWKTVTLLHGAGGNHADWTRFSSIERYANERDIAVIMPDGGTSFYTDTQSGENYKTFITEELPAFCHAHFNTSLRREDNFIGGLSMGGCGSFYLGLSCPETYAGIMCLSASNFAVKIFPDQYANNPRPEWIKWMKNNFGDIFPELEGTEFDHYYLAKKVLEEGKPAPRIFHTIGLQEQENSLNAALEEKEFFESFEGDPFQYTFKGYPGIHNWPFWDTHIEEALDYMGLTKVERRRP
ncbi:MAG: hypothetical protein IJL98_05750 [Lachnospiraceae bacterium]|nr:hypothetical protein [Lachnospiraceae bacterium]